MPDNKPETSYTLQKLGTGAGIGWYQCVPEENPDLETCLRHLFRSPYDRFMHKHALELMKQLPADEFGKLIERGRSNAPHILALVCELTLTSAGFQDKLDLFTSDDLEKLTRYSPEIILPFAGQKASDSRLYWLKCFSRNHAVHERLPAIEEAQFPPLFNRSDIDVWKQHVRNICQMPFAENPRANQHRGTSKLSRKETNRIQKILEGLGILEGWESRTDATLSPFAVERPWRLDVHGENGRNRWRLSGIQTAYGRGMNIHQARLSCLMEIAERYAAFASVEGERIPGYRCGHHLFRGTRKELEEKGLNPMDPGTLRLEVAPRNEAFYWMEGEKITRHGLQKVLVPAQLVILFSNLDEADLTSGLPSNGLGAGFTMEQARLSALLEVVERDSERIMPYSQKRCFNLDAEDSKVQDMLSDLKKKGIHIRFLDMTSELGIPCYKAFVEGPGGVILKGCSAGLDGARAAVSAMTEIPWPYPYWFGTVPPPEEIPSISLEELPDWSSGDITADLLHLETLLMENGYTPVYVDLTREDTGIPVCRAIVPGLEMMTFFDKYTPLGLRQFAHYMQVAS